LTGLAVLSVPGDAPLAEVARVLTERWRKMVPVVDEQGGLLGVIDRADVLAATRSALGGLNRDRGWSTKRNSGGGCSR